MRGSLHRETPRQEETMTEFLDLSQTAQRLCDMDNVLILCHKNPDGDTLGCGAALY